MTQKKRHHYVPIAYLKAFGDDEGKIRVYRKDEPEKPLHVKPENVAFQNYYYSQPLTDGGQDNNTLEDLFSTIESKWPNIVARIIQGENVNDVLEDIFAFIALQKARVPAGRDATEFMLAEFVKATARVMDRNGKLPPKPLGFENILERMNVSIDPHQSIHTMPIMIKAMGEIYDRIGIGALVNKTSIPFLTSDNPVIWFDPSCQENHMRPYTIKPDGPIVLLFPISPNVMIIGNSIMRGSFIQHGFGYGDLSSPHSVKEMNRLICKFAYEAVYSQSIGQEPVILKHAGVSPVLEQQAIHTGTGEFVVTQFKFGPRQKKAKWEK